MKRILFCFAAIVFCQSFTFAEKQFSAKIGPAWPSSLWETEKPTAWDAALQTGVVFDKRVGIGGSLDFLWNNDAKETAQGNGIYQVSVTQRTFMFPICGYLSISPLPQLILSPSISGYVGLNTMYFSYEGNSIKKTATDSSFRVDGNGWYMGLIWKIAADAVLRIGDNSALFAGLEYQWSKPRKLGDSEGNLYLRRNMSGLGVRMGVKVDY
ncbi:MAG: hypothetical protein ACM31E_01190 [Fibrobacterota bacterium]|nr:hypothetical protein [Chitinispirillaceae bacterium]